MSLLEKVKKCDDIDTFKITVFQLKSNFGCMGGRFFFLPQQKGKVKLNDLTRRLYFLFKETAKHEDPSEDFATVKAIVEKLHKLNASSKEDLKQRFIWIRGWTCICRAIGNFFYDRKRIISRMESFLLEYDKKQTKSEEDRKHPLVKHILDMDVPKEVSDFTKSLLKGELTNLPTKNANWDDSCKKISDSLQEKVTNAQIYEIKKIFRALKTDHTRFLILAMSFLTLPNHSINTLATLLEKVDWPSQEMKHAVLPTMVLRLLWKKDELFVEIFKKEEKELQVLHLDLGLERIFGRKNFAIHQEMIAETVLKGLKLHLQKFDNAIEQQGGLRLTLEQTDNMRLPAAMLAPLLPILSDVRSLLALDMQNLCAGFSDDHMDALIKVFKAHPNMALKNFKVFTQFSPKKQEEYNRAISS